MARTQTFTTTFARAEFIALQIDLLIEKITGEDFSDRSRKGIVENQWIETVTLLAVDKADKIRMQLSMKIDWEQHRLHITSGRVKVNVPKISHTEDGFGRILARMAKTFIDYARRESLEVCWTINWCSGVDYGEARKSMHTEPARKRKWIDGDVMHVWGDDDDVVDELSYDFVASVGVTTDKVPDKVRGSVKFFNGHWGFIVPNEMAKLPIATQEDIFVHISQVDSVSYHPLDPGTEVEFEVRISRRHDKRLEAVAVRAVK